MLLWGDSHAADLYPGLASLEQRSRFRIAELDYSRCPPMLGFRVPSRPQCVAVNRYVLHQVKRLAPTEVVLSAAWEYYASVSRLRLTITALRRLGVRDIVVVGPRPEWGAELPQLVYSWYERYRTVPRRLPTNLLSTYPVAQRDQALSLLSRRLRVPYIDAYALFCDDKTCLAWADGKTRKLVMFDAAHLTVAGSRLLVGAFAPLFLPKGAGP